LPQLQDNANDMQIKQRNSSFSHSLHDTVDGMTLATYENLTQISATFFLVDPGPRVTAEKKAI